MDIINNLLADMLSPLKAADASLAEALQIAGKGVQWGGQALGEVGTVLDNMEQKIKQLQDALRGGVNAQG